MQQKQEEPQQNSQPKIPLQKTAPDEWLTIESLDLNGQGVAHNQAGKVVFVEGALPQEQVQVNVQRSKGQWEQAQTHAMRQESALRVKPKCSYYGICGGCAMQHLHSLGQVAVKQRGLEDSLWHISKVKAMQILRSIEGPTWGYRWRARLSVRNVHKKDKVLIGFREKSSRYVADMESCLVLPKDMSDLLMPLRGLIGSMDERDHIPQLEVSIGEEVIALVMRHLQPLGAADLKRLNAFSDEYNQSHQRKLEWWLQPKGPDTAHMLSGSDGGEKVSALSYTLAEHGITMPYQPTDFTQVNPFINQVLVGRAIRCLDIQPTDKVIDWFCGLGNFTLPIAKQALEVLGVEGSETLVAQSRKNALSNQCLNVTFKASNLFELTEEDLLEYGSAQKWLVDPPRDGAMALFEALAKIATKIASEENGKGQSNSYTLPKRIVYVSCNPATLARDAGILVHQAGYTCIQAGVINMFPHTAHVESMAVFELKTVS